MIDRFKKLILKSIEYGWSKMNPVMFIHSSDLMLPGGKELTGIQLFVISRLLDIESRKSGGGYYWHNRLDELYYKRDYSVEEKEEADREFDRFLHAMNARGFNPSLSHIFVAHLPIMGQSDGTHRMGYLLSEKPNVFVPVQIGSPITWTGKPMAGISWLLQIGMPSKEVEQLLKRYHMLYNEMRKHIIAVVNKSVFDKNSVELMQGINIIGIKYAHKKNSNLKMARQYKKFFKNKTETIILEIEMERQLLYYKHGKLKSQFVDIMTSRWNKAIAADVYVAGTITESIELETYLDENYFIEAYTIKDESV